MSIRRATVAVALALLLPAAARAQRASAALPVAPPQGWTVSRDPFADVWFHTMALVGDQGFGVLPLYDADLARASSRRPRSDTAAVERLSRIRRQLAADSTLELLHFVPLYFVGVAPSAALDALDDAAVFRNATASDRAHVVARAIVAALPTASERQTLAEAVAAARSEQGARRSPVAQEGEHSPADLERRWSDDYLPVVGAYLARSGQLRGVIVVAPTIGFDGRVAAIPSLGTVVVVGPGRAKEADAPLLSAVRELAFRVLDRVPVPHEGRVAAARRRDVLAVRGGAILLEGSRRLSDQYRAWYRAASPFPFLTFEQIYPIDAATERALRAALATSGLAQR